MAKEDLEKENDRVSLNKKRGNTLVKDSNISDIIEYFGVDEILEEIDDSELAKRIDANVLRLVDDEELAVGINNTDVALSYMDSSDIIDYMRGEGYEFTLYEDSDDDALMDKIAAICKQIQPNGYIGKEDMKKIITDFIDNKYINSKCTNIYL